MSREMLLKMKKSNYTNKMWVENQMKIKEGINIWKKEFQHLWFSKIKILN